MLLGRGQRPRGVPAQALTCHFSCWCGAPCVLVLRRRLYCISTAPIVQDEGLTPVVACYAVFFAVQGIYAVLCMHEVPGWLDRVSVSLLTALRLWTDVPVAGVTLYTIALIYARMTFSSSCTAYCFHTSACFCQSVWCPLHHVGTDGICW